MRPVIFIRPICLPKTPHYVPLWQRHVEYPKFTPGDPQIRCFLPPFWMKMLYPGPYNPPDHVIFKVHPQMTTMDVQQYLEKIYNVPVLHVRVKMVYHDLEPIDQPLEKAMRRAAEPFMFPPKPDRYEKLAYVRLAPNVSFEFPNLFAKKRPSSALDSLDSSQKTSEDSSVTTATSDSQPPSSPLPTSDLPPLKQLPSWFIR
ncbi:hypothetical protein EG68_08980 [Paragonimus skrjabini miyazakii]|uniref:Large ribosomal subunit protein uL23m n=1 Tax=Paragonimus skrjabini miyazakii TaxID=59628 RepID=A0A8S9YND3_9TREM|nr:hypothetical protein EG68_08980 [Paragonimus skrjabini miyazakii]